MPLDDSLFLRAKSYEREPLHAMLQAVYPAVHRMAHGLTGREDVARGVIRFVMSRAMHQLPLWRDPDHAERWFYHHTVLTARRAGKHPPSPQHDVLVTHCPAADTPYIAFIKALRVLPIQQREALILHHGEKLNTRYLGVAMDCSTGAAEQHLKSAEEALSPLAAGGTAPMLEKLSSAYARLAPTEDLIQPTIRKYIRKGLWPRRIRRAIRLLVSLLVIGAGTYFAWIYRDTLRSLIQQGWTM